MVPPVVNTDPEGKRESLFTKVLAQLVIFALWSAGHIPPDLRSRVGRAIGYLVSAFPSRQRDIAVTQMRRFLGENHPPVGKIYASVAQSALEMCNFDPYLTNPSKYIEFGEKDQAALTDIVGRKKGMVVLVGHLGNWDMLGAYFVQCQGVPVFTAARRARKPALQPGLAWLRKRYKIMTAWRDDRGSVRALVETLRAGGVVASLVDQDTEVESETMKFFGVNAKTPTAIVKLALRLDVPIAITLSIRVGLNKYRFIFEEITVRDSAVGVLEVFHTRLEQLIRENPDQWPWFHKRWRTRENGQRLSTPEYLEWLANPR